MLCSRVDDDVTVCGDVKALVKHVCEDHGSSELKGEEDVVEVVEVGTGEKVAGKETAQGRARSKSESGRTRGSRKWDFERGR